MSVFQYAVGDISYVEDLDVASEGLIVYFAGFNGGLGGTDFIEFGLQVPKTKQIFIRDRNSMLYRRGISPNTNNDTINKFLGFLKNRILYANVKNVTFWGNSAGANAALMYGNLLNVKSVVAVAPFSKIDKSLCIYKILPKQTIDKVINDPKIPEWTLDLLNLNNICESSVTTNQILYDRSSHR
ncbi:hypothetical protein ACFQH1_00045 [Lactiplantibacillus daoliensis]|uniref:Alpha/beta hydrolase n=1 Tax=Lactiplantibacillus daoliensis TaxID=2559916 RepID=A0ABW1UCM6_9LACO